MTKRILTAAGSVALVAMLALGGLAQTSAPAKQGEKAAKPAKTKAAAAPKSDADIQKCINDKLAASKTIKGGTATVTNGVATLTGEASSGGAKGGATRSAKACGAKTVTNNITVAAKTTTKPAEKKAGDKKM